MHQQMEKTGPVKQLEVIIARVEKIFREGDQVSFGLLVYLELMQLARDNTVESIIAHLIALEIDVEITIAVPDPYDLDMLMTVGHLMLIGLQFTQSL
jgi:hypothetical protein